MKTKTCTKCKKRKALSEFYRLKNRKNKPAPACKECARKKRREYARNHREKESRKHREWSIKSAYGLTLEQYDQMFEEQGGVCKICGKINLDGRRLYIDHNHKTGKVRGLLCHKCNSLLGYVDDSIDYLLKIKSYLKS